MLKVTKTYKVVFSAIEILVEVLKVTKTYQLAFSAIEILVEVLKITKTYKLAFSAIDILVDHVFYMHSLRLCVCFQNTFPLFFYRKSSKNIGNLKIITN